MSQEQLHFRVPDVKFRVLIIGRANVGKTSILKRVCETTESLKVYRIKDDTCEEVGVNCLTPSSSELIAQLDSSWSHCRGQSIVYEHDNLFWLAVNKRGDHNIEDELVFTNHDGYIFHDSCGFEAGNEDELRVVQDFVHAKASACQLKDRLHAIWFVMLIYSICKLNSVQVLHSNGEWSTCSQHEILWLHLSRQEWYV